MSRRTEKANICLLITPDKVFAFHRDKKDKVYDENEIPEEAVFLDIEYAVDQSPNDYFVIR